MDKLFTALMILVIIYTVYLVAGFVAKTLLTLGVDPGIVTYLLIAALAYMISVIVAPFIRIKRR